MTPLPARIGTCKGWSAARPGAAKSLRVCAYPPMGGPVFQGARVVRSVAGRARLVAVAAPSSLNQYTHVGSNCCPFFATEQDSDGVGS